MYVITGVGPRCGTSFVMHSLVEEGIPYKGERFPAWTVKEENPNGYYEIDPVKHHDGIQHNDWKDHVVKLWPHVLSKTPPEYIQKIVILERIDKKTQFNSMIRLKQKEEKHNNVSFGMVDDSKIIPKSKELIYSYLDTNLIPTIKVYTEELDKQIDVIKLFIKE